MSDLAQLPDDDALERLIVQALEREKVAPKLREFPLAQPAVQSLDGPYQIFMDALQRSKQVGLALPPKFLLEFREGSPKLVHDGQTVVTWSPGMDKVLEVVVAVNVSLDPVELLRVSYHEIAHLQDLCDAALVRLPRVTHEMRAIKFAQRMVELHR